MVFNTSQMPLLTTLAKPRRKKEVKWTAWLSILCRKNWGARPIQRQIAASPQLDSRGRPPCWFQRAQIGQLDGPAPTTMGQVANAPRERCRRRQAKNVLL
jgi:hypothetical protein